MAVHVLSSSITNRLTHVEQARRVANGDPTADDIVDDSGDELADLAQSINQVMQKRPDPLAPISSTNQVQSVTGELSSISHDTFLVRRRKRIKSESDCNSSGRAKFDDP
ncbi:hypothetical protein O9992_16165 [Vibrio lentus]|nr:hypothetical protein [Vibrio lentus]